MTDTDLTHKPSSTNLVLIRIAVPSKMVTQSSSEVLIRTCTEGEIRIPNTLLKPTVNSDHVVFEARVPRDVAVAIRSMYNELLRVGSVPQG